MMDNRGYAIIEAIQILDTTNISGADRKRILDIIIDAYREVARAQATYMALDDTIHGNLSARRLNKLSKPDNDKGFMATTKRYEKLYARDFDK